METSLIDYLRERPGKGFKPAPHYFAAGDYVTWFLRDERHFARRVDDLLTVYISEAAKDLIGCKIKGVRHILDEAGKFGVLIDDGDVRLGLLFFYGAAKATEEPQRKQYEQLSELAGNATLPRGELQSA